MEEKNNRILGWTGWQKNNDSLFRILKPPGIPVLSVKLSSNATEVQSYLHFHLKGDGTSEEVGFEPTVPSRALLFSRQTRCHNSQQKPCSPKSIIERK